MKYKDGRVNDLDEGNLSIGTLDSLDTSSVFKAFVIGRFQRKVGEN